MVLVVPDPPKPCLRIYVEREKKRFDDFRCVAEREMGGGSTWVGAKAAGGKWSAVEPAEALGSFDVLLLL